jgi:hypothetical protein
MLCGEIGENHGGGGGAKATHPSIPNTMMMATCIIPMILSSEARITYWMVNISSGYSRAPH